MAHQGNPIRRIEVSPLENPVPLRVVPEPSKEPATVTPIKEPVPA
jgi:hypothetical protein